MYIYTNKSTHTHTYTHIHTHIHTTLHTDPKDFQNILRVFSFFTPTYTHTFTCVNLICNNSILSKSQINTFSTASLPFITSSILSLFFFPSFLPILFRPSAFSKSCVIVPSTIQAFLVISKEELFSFFFS